MPEESIGKSRAAAHRMLAGIGGVVLTSIVGSAGVLGTYYPLRDASNAALWLLVLVLMMGESAAIHLPSEIILPVTGWLVVRQPDLGCPASSASARLQRWATHWARRCFTRREGTAAGRWCAATAATSSSTRR